MCVPKYFLTGLVFILWTLENFKTSHNISMILELACMLVDNATYFISLVIVQFNIGTFLLTQHKKASNRHANLPLEMYSFTL